MKKKWFILCVLFFLAQHIDAQINISLNSSNFFNPDIVYYNPAGIGYSERIQSTAGVQSLWLGISGDDLRSSYLSYTHPISKKSTIGLRGVYFNSNLFNQGKMSLIYAHQVIRNKLYVGVNINALLYQYNISKFQLVDPGDPVLAAGNSKNVISYGFGLLTKPLWWLSLGLSLDHLNQPDISIENSDIRKKQEMTFGLCGTGLPLLPQIDFKLIDGDIQIQGGMTKRLFDDRLFVFMGYQKTGQDNSELNMTTNLNVGYFDIVYGLQYPFNELAQATMGSHRIGVQFSYGGPPIFTSRPNFIMLNQEYTKVHVPEILVTGKTGCIDGITKIIIKRNGSVVQNIPVLREKLVDIESIVPLVNGMNQIEVVAYSRSLRSSHKFLAEYVLPKYPPVIRFTEEKTITDTSFYILQASVEDIRDIEQIDILLNGDVIQSNEYTESQDSVSIKTAMQLQEGGNTVGIFAKNALNDTTLIMIVYYSKPTPPEIIVLSPVQRVSYSKSIPFKAVIKDKINIVKSVVRVNQETVYNKIHQESDKKSVIEKTIFLEKGDNIIQIQAENNRLKEEKELHIAYQLLASYEKPLITILSPSEPVTQFSTILFECLVENVDSLSDVIVKLNDDRVQTRSIRVDERIENGFRITKRFDLMKGNNRIEVFAFNKNGQTSEKFDIYYNPAYAGEIYNKKWAFIIGVENYDDKLITDLPKAVSDAQQVDSLLRTNFQFDHVVTLLDKNANKDSIHSILNDKFVKTGPNDAIFFFFAGHGLTKDTPYGALGYILPSDARKNSMRTWLSMDDIKRSARIAPAKHVYYVMDCCYSGLLLTRRNVPADTLMQEPSETIIELAQKRAREVLTAGGRGEEDVDGIFVPRFIKALIGGADDDKDTYLTSQEIGYYMIKHIPKDARLLGWKQHPQSGRLTNDEGAFIFVPKF